MSHTLHTFLLVLGIFWFVLALVANLVLDYKTILSERYINHKNLANAIRKTASCIPSGICLFWISEARWLWAAVSTTAMLMCVFMVFFDPILNILCGQKWCFPGSNDGKHDSIPEILSRNLPIWIQVVIKIVLAAATTYIYIKLL